MATTVSLGFKTPDYSKCGIVEASKQSETPTKTAYPSITIPGNKSLARALKPGQKFTAMVEFVVTEVAIRERKSDNDDSPVDAYGGTRVELEAQSMTIDGVKVSDAEEEVDGATAFRSYMDGKSNKTSEE